MLRQQHSDRRDADGGLPDKGGPSQDAEAPVQQGDGVDSMDGHSDPLAPAHDCWRAAASLQVHWRCGAGPDEHLLRRLLAGPVCAALRLNRSGHCSRICPALLLTIRVYVALQMRSTFFEPTGGVRRRNHSCIL